MKSKLKVTSKANPRCPECKTYMNCCMDGYGILRPIPGKYYCSNCRTYVTIEEEVIRRCRKDNSWGRLSEEEWEMAKRVGAPEYKNKEFYKKEAQQIDFPYFLVVIAIILFIVGVIWVMV